MKKRLTVTLAAVMLVGCAAQRPVLYPNAHLNQVGTAGGERDIDLCVREAEDYVASDGRTERAVETTVVRSGTSAAVGAADGAAGGAVVGHAGRWVAIGAAGGGAAGATRGLIQSLSGKRGPHPVYKNFVNHCLRERGYDPIGWR